MAQAPQTEIDHSQIIDFRAMKNWLEFALRAGRQRRRLVFTVAGAMFVVALILVNVIPKTYRVQSRVLAQKNSALALRGDTNGESATKSASDMVSRRENVLNLVKQTNLVAEWKAHRGALARAKDAVKGLVSQPMTEQQETDALADYLLTKMLVYNDETSVTFQVDWRDPLMAYRLVDALQRGYLDARHVQEVSSLAEAVSIYEGRAATIREQVNAAVAELQALRERKQKEEKNKPVEKEPPKEPTADKPAQPGVQPAAAPAEAPEVIEKRQQRIAELGVAIESKERMLNDLESTRIRRLNDLQAKLQELRAVYTEQHPAVTELKQGIISASQESPQVGHLRDELKQLRGEYDQLRIANGGTPGRGLARGGGGRPASVTAGGGLGDVIRIEQESAEERDPEIEYARSKLRFAIQSYQTNGAEIDKTVVDLKTAEAAFKYRYTVVTPPELPKGPIAPKAIPIVLAALIGGLLIGLIGAVALELRQGTLYAPWQVEHGLSLRVLSNVSLPALPGKRS
ncbi:MAG TPA: hypothetical protein VG937_25515 [Polyangiaceae bacterium]|nr:hypothetical protein [Polyangiaceae bacterium]